MTTTEDVLKEFDEKFDTKADLSLAGQAQYIKKFILSTLSRQRQSDMEEVIKICEEMVDVPYMRDDRPYYWIGRNESLKDIQARLEANMKKV